MIDESHLLIEVRRYEGPIGAATSVDPAVRVTHVPTGLVAVSESLDTQGANKSAVIEELERLLAAREQEALDQGDPGADGAV